LEEGMTRLRVAVIGVGHLGQHHARVLAENPDVELVAVADARSDQARRIAEKHGTRAVSDHRCLLDAVDAVSVAVPTCLHRDVAGAFLERGIATLVEKPMAATLAEAEELAALAARTGAVLQVGHIERFNPALAALDSLPMRPKFIASERLSTYTFRSTDIGVVLDLMIHDIDLVLSMISAPVRSVEAVGVSVFGAHEDVANARIAFEDGCVANLTASRASLQALRKMRLWAAEGYATLDFAARQGTLVRPSDQLRHGELDLAGVDLSQPDAVKDHLFGKVLRVDRVEAESRDQLTQELNDFITAVRTGARPRVDGRDGLRAMRVADQVLRSIDAHQWEGIPSGPIGPHHLPQPLSAPASALRGPLSWRVKSGRKPSSHSPQS
jgi:predicted dehydrogenase